MSGWMDSSGEGQYDASEYDDAQETSWAFATVHDLHEIIKTHGAKFVIKNLTKSAQQELIKAWLDEQCDTTISDTRAFNSKGS